MTEARGPCRPLSVAPMMDCTDRHYRFMMRHITRHTLLYTEMIPVNALLHGDCQRLLDFSPLEKPLALQLGGDDPQSLARCARLAAEWGYDEVNLNVGCPSDRVQNGNFGACLMGRPEIVAEAVQAMRQATSLPVTVKHRIGIDDRDRYEDMAHFVEMVASAGCDRFIVHARKAVLQGLSPKENRTVPPLRYDDVYRLKVDYPALRIEINGGITTLAEAQRHRDHMDGVMIGRAAYDHPYLFASADQSFWGEETPPQTRRQVLKAMLEYLEAWLPYQAQPSHIVRPLLNLFAYQRAARVWKRALSGQTWTVATVVPRLQAIIAQMPEDVLDACPTGESVANLR